MLSTELGRGILGQLSQGGGTGAGPLADLCPSAAHAGAGLHEGEERQVHVLTLKNTVKTNTILSQLFIYLKLAPVVHKPPGSQ